MKRILIYTDVHFCQFSSIVRKQFGKYSQRLKGLIDSVNWAESLAQEKGCDTIMCLGDFFDKSHLNAAELSALKDIKWAENIPHYFLVGNHEMAESSLEISSVHVLNLIPNVTVVERITLLQENDFDIILLPYILECNRFHISEYCEQVGSKNRRLILSHNDIAGLQFGAYTSQTGFEIDDISDNCDLFINGHIHNGSWVVSNCILNLGNLTGQNFSEDATKYPHQAMILNLPETAFESFSWEFYKNPYAFNFYKLGKIMSTSDFPKFATNAVVSCGCTDEHLSEIKNFLQNQPNVIEFRLVLDTPIGDIADYEGQIQRLQPIDHLAMFQSKMMEMLGSSDIVTSEIERVLS